MKTYPTNSLRVPYSPHRSNFLSQIQNLQIATLTASIVGIVITFACSKGMYLTALLALIGLLIAFPKVLLMLYGKFEQMIRHSKYSPVLLLGIAIGFLIGLLLIFTVEPAQAQFFNKTQTWMTGAIPGIDTGLVALIFNVLRALFVIYLGIGLVKVIQSARNDDDWQQMARTPLILVVTVTMGDILAGIITGAT
ncbi:hypothetical protein H6F42_21025 [Pseudanabaena sp. FACHB-1998]|uniref:hypothetical protein n=1 Tax=Pseudanabaena sp. FACHB-1998 TaxID=2692858 RepID=UPI0016803BF2|nr:hypothetical protein [Pseudanabaena sp. FACHB-1998]MBD2179404.1 hypothetical protein [Pseudanabaena sp. FACHB-1998]